MLKKKIPFSEMSDEALMELYQKGEERSFNLIYERYASRVLGFLRKKTKSDRAAQDLTQEVFLKLHRSRALYQAGLPLAPWIFTIARNIFLDFAKKKSKEDVTAPEELEQIVESPGESAPGVAPSVDLLQNLPETQRQVVSLRVFDEATFEEIAARLMTSPENARQIFSRALKKLKNQWRGKEIS